MRGSSRSGPPCPPGPQRQRALSVAVGVGVGYRERKPGSPLSERSNADTSLCSTPKSSTLEHGVNGFVVAGSAGPHKYAAVVIDLLQDESTWDQLRAGAMSSVGHHTVGETADHFPEGLQAALHSGGGPTIS